jgi:four helix bundle protein
MEYADWEASVPEEIRRDALWSVEAYRLGLFVAKLGWEGVTILFRDYRTRSLADQLYRALGSISANIAEGYSRSTEMDRARFYEYALGSARESRDWYYKSESTLTCEIVHERIRLLTVIIRQIIVILNNLRKRVIRETPELYAVSDDE